MKDRAGIRVTGPLVSMVTPLTSYALYIKGTTSNKKVRLKKIMWCNRAVGNGALRIGYLTLGGVFTPVLPDILMIGGGATDQMTEKEIPEGGNAIDGFIADTTPVTGTLGNIIAQATVGGAVPNDVQIRVEVEEE